MSLPQTVNTISNLLRVDLNEIPYDQIAPNSLLIIRGSAKDMPDMTAVIQELKTRVDPSVFILVTSRDTDVLSIPEEVLNEVGWYKKVPFESPIKRDEMSVEEKERERLAKEYGTEAY